MKTWDLLTRQWTGLWGEGHTIFKLDNGETFMTNEFGHVEALEFRPSLNKRGRDSRQTAKGNEGLEGDVGGHLRACALDGTCDAYNLFIQDGRVNNSPYKRWENMIRDRIEDVGRVRVTLIRNDPSEARPNKIKAGVQRLQKRIPNCTIDAMGEPP